MGARSGLHPRRLVLFFAAAVACVVSTGACGFDWTLGYNPPPPSPPSPPDLGQRPDMSLIFPPDDPGIGVDLGLSFPCLEGQPGCHHAKYGPPEAQFPMQSDEMQDPLAKDNGVSRDVNGYLKLDSTHSVFNYLWIPNTHDLGDAGTVSKLDTKTVREVARYQSVTCFSLKTGSTAQCDGVNGCCSVDDWARFQARKNKMPEPQHQGVQKSANLPSRTGVDFNGDLFVANEAPGGQASVTRIANDLSSCIDRNHNGKIDTSSDTNGDGSIDTDCNADGQPDDIASVQGKPCKNNLKQEYYGSDDECVVWTTNVLNGGGARALGLAGGDNGASSLWVGSFTQGVFERVNGVNGLGTDQAQLPGDCFGGGSGPNGLVVDASGIAWAPQQGAGKLCYFNTKTPAQTGVVRDPQWGPMEADGVMIDRDQNIWVGRSVARYTPDRTVGFNNLGSGWWTRMDGVTGTRIVADSRTANSYFVYSCTANGVLQIPASTLKVMKTDRTEINPGWPVIQMPCLGVEVDSDQNVWGLDPQLSTRALVDRMGAVTPPKVNAPPMGLNKCPAGDSCAARGSDPYSNMAGFGLRNFSRPAGSYQVLVRGCVDKSGMPALTDWQAIEWDSDVPPNTSLPMHARSGNWGAFNDPGWGLSQLTPDFSASPGILRGVLTPNWDPDSPADLHDGWLIVEFIFKTQASNASPKLKNFRVTYRCPDGS